MRVFEGKPSYDDMIGGRVKMIEGIWYWTEWHVAYAQGGVNTSDNFVTREEAEAHFHKRLADMRPAFGHKGNKFTEEPCKRPNGGKAIRFRIIRKNGKPGAITGLLYMDKIIRG